MSIDASITEKTVTQQLDVGWIDVNKRLPPEEPHEGPPVTPELFVSVNVLLLLNNGEVTYGYFSVDSTQDNLVETRGFTGLSGYRLAEGVKATHWAYATPTLTPHVETWT